MNKVFTAKFLQHLNKKKADNQEKGFTLIELLVVVIIIGVLAAVALPNLLSQVGKARETEIKNTTGTINRAQQAYHFERQNFGTSAAVLGVAIQNEYIDNVNTGITATNATTGLSSAVFVPANAEFANDGTRAYAGGVYHSGGNYSTFVCQSNEPASTTTAPTVAGACASNAVKVR
ncbi:prepilin-type cleavage/methylation domain-containing protein [Pleurocapsa sp. CCALA 161]|uniref:type IV pilin protein n=1 Tax=Pleurocapsa sp. CCALA 161 TaxID=2107688 RepID=UPI000D0702FB|nr:type IV pilin-like G/H family protein [Pleurocapsa sp. CCALA 161]PSB08612.1 prepilin-type cleavage/methylation domain-containing protein [Pleurocapsa sp. CCALA 161]